MFRRLGVALAVMAAAASLPAPAATAAAAPGRIANVAHRGASAYAPENTIAAFRLAREQRADLFELDVQETRDHRLVLMHDTTLARTTNAETVFPGRAPWRVADFTLAEIRRLDAGSWFAPEFAGEPVPTLGESLRAMRDSGLGLLLEIKAPSLYPGIERRVAAELRLHPSWLRAGPDGRRLIVQSFDFSSMRRFHRLLPDVPIGLLGTPPAAHLPGLAEFADQINPTHTDLTAGYVRRVHALGMEVFTWTMDDAPAMRRAAGLGVDGIITNRPDVLNEVLPAREAA
ncbi:hydrolase [Planobispora rosea]|uniref:Hydrolase n=1 Tax=Planobispora rosea TaxID=35762 RepID=A0A8J3WH59_PLARO|nr:glycerophosphodiester phosphodiesterase family protein [Planobispora rosea]GGT02084.1 hydrolase [Planobispora rosea]GIH88427.1 hydrolase [Planobispora rosea]